MMWAMSQNQVVSEFKLGFSNLISIIFLDKYKSVPGNNTD